MLLITANACINAGGRLGHLTFMLCYLTNKNILL
tara:strand:+ start:238 stop:339 length:102 start_codon:yes stop_codon:yes gene_type:complete